jgi:hypothetical protein
MASGTINGTTNNQYIESRIVWSSYVIEGTNTSRVTAALYYRRTNSGYTTSGTGTFKIFITKVGNTWDGYALTKSLSISTEWVKAVENTWTVSHDTNTGAKKVSFKCEGSMSGTTLTSTTCTGTVDLDLIAYSTQVGYLRSPTGYLDAGLTYTLTSGSPHYTRVRIYVTSDDFGSILLRTIDYGQIGRNKEQTQDITFSDSELSQIYKYRPDNTLAPIVVIATTYTDSGYTKRFGNDSQASINMYIPRSVGPKVSLTVSPVNDNSWFKSKGLYVAGYSGLSATLSAMPGEGAWLTSKSVAGAGYSSNSETLSINQLSKSGAFTVTGTAIDSRARSGIAPQDITVEPYSVPSIYNVKVTRGKYDKNSAKWTADDNGPDVRVYFIASLALADYGNTYSVAFALDGTAKTPDAGNPEGLRSGIDYAFHFLNVESERSHALTITATDLSGNTGAAAFTVPTTQVTIEFNGSGKGIAFGKTSEKDAFECAMPAEFTGGVTIDGQEVDVVVEEGGVDFWTYRKWKSGLLECWGTTYAVTLSFDGDGNGAYYGITVPSFRFPEDSAGVSMFIETPTVQQTCDAGSAIIVSAISHVDSEQVNLTYGRFYGGIDDKEVEFHFYARGRWK